MLTLTNTAAAAVTLTAGASYVNGPLVRTLPAGLVSGSTYLFPIGKSAFKMLELVNPTTNAGGTVTVRGEVFDADSGGSAGTGLQAINHNRYWSAQITAGAANFTSSNIRLTEAVSAGNAIGQAATQAGSYVSIGGTLSSNTILSTVSSTSLGYFVVGVLTGQATISGTFTICASGCNYVNLTAAVADLNSKQQVGPVTFLLNDATYAGDTFPISIAANGGASSTNTLTIRPIPAWSPRSAGRPQRWCHHQAQRRALRDD